MSVPYTKPTIIDNVTPAVSAATFQPLFDVVKTIADGGAGSGVDADLVGGHDLTTQTPLNSGLVCAPMATVPEWPDGDSPNFFEDAWLTDRGWTGLFATVTAPGGGVLQAVATEVNFNVFLSGLSLPSAGYTIRAKVRLTVKVGASNAYKLYIRCDSSSFLGTSFDLSDGQWKTVDAYFAATGLTVTEIGITSYSSGAVNDVLQIDWFYIGDGTYTSKALDGSGNGNHATVVGATPVDTVAGRGFSFDGVNDYCHIPMNITFTSYTFSLYQSKYSHKMAISTDDASLYKYGEQSWKDNNGEWYHNIPDVDFPDFYVWAITWDGLKLRAYINGVLKAETVWVYSSMTLNTMLILGKHRDSGFEFSGTIADPRIYNRVLSAEEVWELYSKPGMAKLSGPVHSATAVPHAVAVRDSNGDVLGAGGQPPSAKSNKTSATTIGWFDSVDCASGAQVTLPAGGTFEWFVSTYGATYNSVKSGVSAGGLMTGTASANLTMRYKRLL